MSSQEHYSVRASLHRLLATGSAMLVFALGLMSVSPTLHDWVHRQPCDTAGSHAPSHKDPLPYGADHSCAVVGFAHGLTLAVDTVLPENPPIRWAPTLFPCPTGHVPVEQHEFLPPGRAPPASLS